MKNRNGEMRVENLIKTLDQKIIEKFKIKVDYILVECTVCKHTWGINVHDNQIMDRNLICNECAADLLYQQVK